MNDTEDTPESVSKWYRRVEVVVTQKRRLDVLQKVVRDAVIAAGYEIEWSATSAACSACKGRGYVNDRPIDGNLQSCLWTSDNCFDCGGSGRPGPIPASQLEEA